MKTAIKLPPHRAARLELGPGEIRMEATYEEFVEWLTRVDYPIEFEHNEIVLMSIASDEHERIVANILGLLFMVLKSNPEYGRYGSNRHVYLEAQQKAYSPDASVVKGAPQAHTYARGKAAYTNPWLVVEVISSSSKGRDYGEKLPAYKEGLPSLQYILYVAQDRPFVTLYERIEDSNRWRSTDYDALDQEMSLGEYTVAMSDVYDNLNFGE